MGQPSSTPPVLNTGSLIHDRFRIKERIGFGGFGEVYKAVDERLTRTVAVKILHTRSEALDRRFYREARLLAALQHANVVMLFDFGTTDGGYPYIVQEWLDGVDLSRVIADRDSAGSAAIPILLQVATALAAAHEGGLVHRDIKPSNVRLLPSGQVKLIDFGLARSQVDREEVTTAGEFVGTIAYAAPEQFGGQRVDQRADVYSFGVLAYELATGTRLAPLSERLHNGVQDLDLSQAPDALRTLIARCLERDPALRPQNGEELLRDLREVCETRDGLQSRPAGRPSDTVPLGTPGYARSALQSEAESYLKVAGFTIAQSVLGFTVARRLDDLGEPEYRLLWTLPSLRAPDHLLELNLERQFELTTEQYPVAKRLVLLEDLARYSNNFRQVVLRRFAISQRVAAQFFDSPFKGEGDLSFDKLLSAVAGDALGRDRIPQPFLDESGESSAHQEDLLAQLVDHISSRRSGCLHLVLGPAGIGKTVLFSELVRSLWRQVLEAKKHQRTMPRPIPFRPQDLQWTRDWTLEGLIGPGIRDRLQGNLDVAAFRWLLAHGYSVWLFDGLEEVYSGDRYFFPGLLDLLAEAGPATNIVVFARTSLLNDPVLAALLAADSSRVKRYSLQLWQEHRKQRFSLSRLSHGAADEKGIAAAERFMTELRERVPGELSGLPFFLDVLMREFETNGALGVHRDECSPIAKFVDRYLERELLQKQEIPLSPHHFDSHDSLLEWLTEVAILSFSRGPFAGVDESEALAEIDLYLRSDLGDEERSEARRALPKLPLLETSPGSSRIRFRFDLVEEYLASTRICAQVATSPADALRAVASLPRVVDRNSLVTRQILSLLGRSAEARRHLAGVISRQDLSDERFRKGLQLILWAPRSPTILKDLGVRLSGRDLGGLEFESLDLSGTSLEGADLTVTRFVDCDLRGTDFRNAAIIGTAFVQQATGSLVGARFGDLTRVQTLVVGGRTLSRGGELGRWIAGATGSTIEIREDCAAVMTLREILLKYFHIDGKPIRHYHQEHSLGRGRRFPGGPTVEETVEALRAAGILSKPDYRKRVSYVRTESHEDVVAFVSQRVLQGTLGGIVAGLCNTRGCPHLSASGSN